MNGKFKALCVAPVLCGLIAAAVATAASSPSAQTGPATNRTQFSAVLRGTVNPNGIRTEYVFQWGETTTYGNSSRMRSAGRGTKPVAVRAALAHLRPGTVYHYRLVAISKLGWAVAKDRVFRTTGNPPAIATTGASTQPATSAVTLTGEVNPNHQTTTWYFNYGLSTAYGSRTVPGVLTASSPPMVVSQRIEGLASGTVFHYQLVAVNRGVPSFGADATFMTFPNPAPAPRVHAKTKPRRARHRPFVLTTSGRIAGPTSFPSQFACAGTVRIRFQLHRRRVATTLANVGPDCTFAAQTTFQHRPGHHRRRAVRLRVVVRYLGDGYLAPADGRIEHVTLG